MDHTSSPMQRRPLRSPVRSLDAEIDRLWAGKAHSYLLIALITLCLALFEWIRFFLALEPSPLSFSLVAAIIFVFTYYKMRTFKEDLATLRMGRDAKKVVRRYLDGLRVGDFAVLHHVKADPFNLDHVVFSTHGVFLVEAKEGINPDRSQKLVFDGRTILAGTMPPDRNPIVQARSNAIWLRKKLKAATGKDYPVKSVLVYPGWQVDGRGDWKESDVWVINHNDLRQYMGKQPVSMTADDVTAGVQALQ